jgi:mono/diheme cytochrome c family protein
MWKTNLKVLMIALVVVGFYTTVAHVIPQLQSEVPEALALGSGVTPEALVAAGEKIYNGAGGCTACHGLGTRAPNLVTDYKGQGAIGARCGTRKPGMACKAYLYESLTQPQAYIVQGFDPIMPDMRKQLSDDQIWAAVAFLESQGGEVDVTGEDVAKSAPAKAAGPAPSGPAMTATLDPVALYSEKGCIGCHQMDGKGGAIGPSWDHVGSRRSAASIRKKILSPSSDTTKGYEKFAGMMPATFGQMLTAAQLEALVTFLAKKK